MPFIYDFQNKGVALEQDLKRVSLPEIKMHDPDYFSIARVALLFLPRPATAGFEYSCLNCIR